MRTYKQGLLAFSFAVAISTGCTYNEDDLHAGRHDAAVTPGREDAPPAADDVPGEPDAGIVLATDAEASDLGSRLDTPGTADSSPDVPAPDLDAGTEVADAADGQPDSDAAPPDAAKDDASTDLSKDAHGPDTGTPAIDGKLTEVGGVDGTSG